jgi:hypothetical protein
VLAVGDGRAEDAVRPVPDLLPGECVEPVGAPVPLFCVPGGDAPAPRAGGEVDDAVDHTRGAVHRRGGGEAPEAVARCGVEGHEVPVVRSDVDPPLPDGGRGVDVGACVLRPQEPAARGSEGVERPVRVPDEDPPVRDRRCGVEVLTAAEARPGFGLPPDPAGARVQRVEASGVGPEVDLSGAVRRRAVDLTVRRERPARLARVDVDRVHLVVPGARVERLADHEWRGLEGAAPERPDQLARPGRHRRDHPGLAPRVTVARQGLHPGVVDDAVRDRRGRRRAVVEPALPDDLAGAMVDRKEAPALVGDVEPPVGDRRRELEHVVRLERPAQTERRLEMEVGRGMRPLHLQAVGRPGQAQDDPARTLLLGCLQRRHELDRRRPALGLDRVLPVKPKAEGDPEPQGARDGQCVQQPDSRHPAEATDGARGSTQSPCGPPL